MDFAGPQVEVDALQGLYSLKFLLMPDSLTSTVIGSPKGCTGDPVHPFLHCRSEYGTAGCSICHVVRGDDVGRCQVAASGSRPELALEGLVGDIEGGASDEVRIV